MKQLGFIGVGNMGYPMLIGAMKFLKPQDIIYTTKTLERMEHLKAETGIDYVLDKTEVVAQCKYLVLAVKPQFYEQILTEIRDYVKEGQIIITVAPGIATSDVKYSLKEGVKVVRSMPNTPALVGEGMSGVCFSKDKFTQEEKSFINGLFSSFGRYVVVEEHLMDAVVCASGSSPAYVFLLIEALADSIVKYGISRTQAYELVAQTVLGAAKMVLDTKQHPAVLKDNVCSPGGTTIAGLAALEEHGFRNAIMKATDACYEKVISLKNK